MYVFIKPNADSHSTYKAAIRIIEQLCGIYSDFYKTYNSLIVMICDS